MKPNHIQTRQCKKGHATPQTDGIVCPDGTTPTTTTTTTRITIKTEDKKSKDNNGKDSRHSWKEQCYSLGRG